MTHQGSSSPRKGDHWPTHVLSELQKLQQNDDLCDTDVVAIDGSTFHVHSCVLAACSSLLAHQLLRQTPRILRIDASKHAVEALVKFIYTGTLTCLKEDTNEILHFASKLGVGAVLESLEYPIDLYALNHSGTTADEPGCSEAVSKNTDHMARLPDTLEEYGMAIKHDLPRVTMELQRKSKEEQYEHIGMGSCVNRRFEEAGSNRESNDKEDVVKETVQRDTGTPELDNTSIIASHQAEVTNARQEKKHSKNGEGHKRKGGHCYQCSECDKVYKHSVNLRRHEKWHKGVLPYQCALCEKSYLCKGQLNTHVMAHTGERPFVCKYCCKGYTSRTTVNMHERFFCRLSKLEERKSCGKCQAVFWSKRILEEHVCAQKCDEVTVHKTQTNFQVYTCSVCQKEFPRKQNLQAHELTHTQRDQPYVCGICCKTFVLKKSLEIHTRKHREGRKYMCSFCSKAFFDMAGLRLHERVHTGAKPFPCKFCDKSFRSHSLVRTHERTHTGERNYQCNTCGKRFADLAHLKRHENIHSDSVHYSCQLCGKDFRRKDNLQRHCASVHKGPSQ